MNPLWPGRGGPALDYITAAPPARAFPANVAILGCTGSIGRNTLAVVEETSADLKIIALGGGRNVELLARQALRHKPPWLAVIDEPTAEKLRELLPSTYRPRILWGAEGYDCLASLEEADVVVAAQVGFAGLAAAVAAALAGKIIALANKEALVIAGDALRAICAKSGAVILPVDSEHYALFQCCAGRGQDVDSLILTASGGPFRGKDREWLEKATPADALKHPNWSMGAKITIDSATLMNKGLEVIEAMRLYGLGADKIDVVVHPQSVIHSLARFRDASLLAQAAVADMRLPIAACLLWPRCQKSFVRPLELLGNHTFEKPDVMAFPCLEIARAAARTPVPPDWAALGANPACLVLNAANEAAVELFLQGRRGFNDIPRIIAKTLEAFARFPPAPVIDNLSGAGMAAALAPLDAAARNFALNLALDV